MSPSFIPSSVCGSAGIISGSGCCIVCMASGCAACTSIASCAANSSWRLRSCIAESSSSSFFDLRPLCLGIAESISSGVIVAASASAFVCALGSASSALFFLTSKFSPSLPFTVYTRSVSFLVILVRRRFVPSGFLLPSISACLSSIAYTSSSGLPSAGGSMPISCAISCNSAISLADNSSLLYMDFLKKMKDYASEQKPM